MPSPEEWMRIERARAYAAGQRSGIVHAVGGWLAVLAIMLACFLAFGCAPRPLQEGGGPKCDVIEVCGAFGAVEDCGVTLQLGGGAPCFATPEVEALCASGPDYVAPTCAVCHAAEVCR